MVSFFHAAKKNNYWQGKKTTIGRAERATAKVVFLTSAVAFLPCRWFLFSTLPKKNNYWQGKRATAKVVFLVVFFNLGSGFFALPMVSFLLHHQFLGHHQKKQKKCYSL
jgi:hypothetical protein